MAAKADKNAVSQRFGDERRKALEVALGKIEKDFGKGSVMKLGDAGKMQVEVIRGRSAPRPNHRGIRPGILR